MNIKNTIFTLLITFAVWLLLNNSLESQIIITGIIVSAVISLLFGSKIDLFSELKLSPKSILYIPIYLVVFLKELVKSNLELAMIVIQPKIHINPGIVKVKTKLKSKMGRLLLANSITLTPGTLTVDIDGEYFYIHWINVKDKDLELATKEIVTGFEKYLEVIYG